MKKTKTISTTLTDEEFEQFKDAWLEAENTTGERINVSTFLRDTIMNAINGNSPPSVEESIPENVSNTSEDTFPEFKLEI